MLPNQIRSLVDSGWKELTDTFTIPKPLPVLSKRDFTIRYGLGEFGNCSPTCNTIEEYLQRIDFTGLVHIRNRVAGGRTWYNVPHYAVEETYYDDVMREGDIKPGDVYFSAMCPTEKTLIQGEVYQRVTTNIRQCGLYLLYTHVKKPMRDALKESSLEATGLTAQHLLRHYMDTNSSEWLQHLLDSYPSHVIEFTTLSTKWGTVEGYNSLFWEVRNY